MVSRDRSLRQKMVLALCMGMLLYFSSAGQALGQSGGQTVAQSSGQVTGQSANQTVAQSSGQAGSGNGGGQMLLSRTYDTLIAGNGYGNYKLSFSQWDPRLGELKAIRIKTLATVQYGFTLRNVDTQQDSFAIMVGRKDTISSAFIVAQNGMVSPSANTTPNVNIGLNSNFTLKADTSSYMFGPFPLDTGQAQTQAPYALLSNYDHTDSITDNMASFIGTGEVSFIYSPITWSKVSSNYHSTYYYNATIRDTTRFSLTYLYTAGEVAGGLTGPDQPGGNDLTLYPNPATGFIYLTFNDPVPGDWQVDILAADGRLMQRNNYYNTNMALVNFYSKLPEGVYFARATDSRTSRTHVGKFVVR